MLHNTLQHYTTKPAALDSKRFVECVNQNFLLLNYLHDVKDTLHLYELSSGRWLRELPLDVGTVVGISCKKKHTDFFYKFTSFTTPGIIYHYDLSKPEAEPTVFRQVEVKGVQFSDYQTTQNYYNDVLVIIQFYFGSNLLFVRHLGGILAVANIRGGGEYGQTWHKGTRTQKLCCSISHDVFLS
ncbi:prolyl endopeptidase-like [Tachysurus ichikawai]